jgi:hypothetical protein
MVVMMVTRGMVVSLGAVRVAERRSGRAREGGAHENGRGKRGGQRGSG